MHNRSTPHDRQCFPADFLQGVYRHTRIQLEEAIGRQLSSAGEMDDTP